jgi:hypothetical protein
MSKLFENTLDMRIKNVNKKNAGLPSFSIHVAKNTTTEPGAGNFGESVKM